MNKIKIVKLNVKKKDKKIYDFNILKLDLNKNNTDKIIDDYIDSFIKEFVEIIDFQYNNISDIILSLVDDLKIKVNIKVYGWISVCVSIIEYRYKFTFAFQVCVFSPQPEEPRR